MIERLRRNHFLWYQGPVIVWAAALFTQSSIPGNFIPSEGFFNHDKLIHFLIYLVFAAAVHRAIRFQDRFPLLKQHHYIFTILIVMLFGASDELHQYFVPNRSCRLNDWVADTLGAIVYTALHWLKNITKPATPTA